MKLSKSELSLISDALLHMQEVVWKQSTHNKITKLRAKITRRIEKME